MNQPIVTAEWAWISKEPGARADYAVLAASQGAFDVGSFTRDYLAGVPDDLDVPEGSPLERPWVLFGSHTVADQQQMLSLSVVDPWQGQDQSGRRIWPRRFFFCPYMQVATVGASYLALWEAARDRALPAADAAPLRLAPHSEALGRLKRVIEGIGVDQVAAIAAALLDNKPVAVMGAVPQLLHEEWGGLSRIAVLDAVAALLPYGFRADLSASSAVSNRVAYQIRLVFTDSVKRSHRPRSLQGSPVPPESADARTYQDMLLKKIGKPAGLDKVLEHLWNIRQPRSFSRPWEALEDLAGLDRDSYEIEAAIQGKEGTDTSLHFFHGPVPELERKWRDHRLADYRHKLVRPLLYPRDERALQPLQAYWNIIEAEVIEVANQWLDQEQSDGALTSLVAASSLPLPESVDRLLMMLLVPPDMAQLSSDQNPDWQQRFRARVALLRQVNVPPPGAFPKTCQMLRAGQSRNWQGQLVRDVLFHDLAERPEHGLAVARWLCLSEVQVGWQDWAMALQRMIAPHLGWVDVHVIQALLAQDDRWAAVALGLAASAQRVPEALEIPGLAAEFVSLAIQSQESDGTGELQRVLTPLASVHLSPRQLGSEVTASVDIARLFLNQPPDFPYDADDDAFSDYNEGLLKAFKLPAVTESRVDVESWFLRVVMDNMSRGRQLPPGAISMLRSWSRQLHFVAKVARYAAQPRVTSLLMADPQLEDEFWSPLVRYEPALIRVAAVPVLRGAVRRAIAQPHEMLDRFTDVEAGVTGSKLAQAMYRAMGSGMPPEEILAVMIGVTVDHRDLTQAIKALPLYGVFCQLESMLANPAKDSAPAENMTRKASAEIFIEFTLRICDGAWGARFAKEFKKEVPRRLDSDISARKQFKKMIRGRPWYWPFGGRSPYYPTNPDLAAGMGSPGHQEARSRPAEPVPRALPRGGWGSQDPEVTQPSRPDLMDDAHPGDGPPGDGLPSMQLRKGRRWRPFRGAADASDQRAGVSS